MSNRFLSGKFCYGNAGRATHVTVRAADWVGGHDVAVELVSGQVHRVAS